jgi:hypothetical protein
MVEVAFVMMSKRPIDSLVALRADSGMVTSYHVLGARVPPGMYVLTETLPRNAMFSSYSSVSRYWPPVEPPLTAKEKELYGVTSTPVACCSERPPQAWVYMTLIDLVPSYTGEVLSKSRVVPDLVFQFSFFPQIEHYFCESTSKAITVDKIF